MLPIIKSLLSKNYFITSVLIFIFLVAGLITLPHYGINWDTINHLPRGQAYLHYLLTGEENYASLPVLYNNWDKPEQWYWQDPTTLGIKTNLPGNSAPQRSYYQLDALTYEHFMEHDGGGHPPLSDILSSVVNKILFSKLKIINDIDAYRVYGITLAALLVGLVFYWVSKIYGNRTGVISSLILATYPLFWSESHFNNEKDIPQTAFWYFTLFSFWKAVKERKFIWFILTGLFLGLGIGTKFNIIFIGFVIIPWLFLYVILNKLKVSSLFKISIFGSLSVLLAIIIFVATWPYLWPDPLSRVESVIGFYKSIGTTLTFNPDFIIFNGINAYPSLAIIFTTPIVLLPLFFVGIYLIIKKTLKGEDKNSIGILFLLCFFVPLIRTSWPGANIYGGLRQIMEYIPAMAVIAAIGFTKILDYMDLYSKKYIKKINSGAVSVLFIGLLMLSLAIPLVKYHPSENVYFNELIGGLKGAKTRDFPYWGNTFGAAYRNGVDWLNKNAYEGAQVAYARELIPNFPKIWLRPDLKLHNGYRSGYLQEKEYVIGLVYDDTEMTSYHDRFLDRMLMPVYEVRADDVAVLKVWLNDEKYLKEEYKKHKLLTGYSMSKSDGKVTFEFKEKEKVSRIEARHALNSCKDLQYGYVEISTDGLSWERLPGTMPKEDWSVPKLGFYPEKDKLLIAFAADEAKFIRINYAPAKGCFETLYLPKIYVFEK